MIKNQCPTEVYVATNAINGKRYIGVTKKGIAVRKADHVYHAKSMTRPQTKFTRAIRKYGKDAFDFKALSLWDTFDAALQEEVRLIALLKPEYNTTIGGEGVFIANRSERKLWNKRISKALMGRKPSEFSIQRTKELAHLRAKKMAMCLNDGRTGKIKEMSKIYNITEKALRAICGAEKGWTSDRGRFFVFTDGSINEDQRLALLAARKERTKNRYLAVIQARSRPVICLTNGKSFPSGAAAARTLGISQMRVVQLCQMGGQTQSGLRFMYADADAPPQEKGPRTQEQIQEGIAKRNAALARGLEKNKKKVMCVENGAVFNSITEASRFCGRSISAVSSAIHRSGKSGKM